MPSYTNPAQGQGRRTYVAAAAEATFGSAATLTHVLMHMCDFEPAEVTPDVVENNKFSSGILTDAPTRHLVKAKGGVWTPNFMASLEAIGITLSKILGNDTKAVAGSNYSHTMTFDDLPGFLPGWTVEEHMGGRIGDSSRDTKPLGVAIDEWELAVGDTDFGVLNLKTVLSGREGSVGTITETGLVIPMDFCTLAKSRLSFEGPIADGSRGTSPWSGSHAVGATAGNFPSLEAGATDVSAECRGYKLRVKSGISAPQRGAGSSNDVGYYGSSPRAKARYAELEMTLVLDDATEQFKKARSGSSWTTQIEYAAYLDIAGPVDGQGFQAVLPITTVSQTPAGLTGTGEQLMTVTFQWRKTSVGTDRKILSSYCVNGDNIDYA